MAARASIPLHGASPAPMVALRPHASESSLQRRVESAVRRMARGGRPRLILAVSGGRDSMALLHAAARATPAAVAMVGTFDHGTGPAATAAAEFVAARAADLGLPVVIGHSADVGASEAEWRHQRHAFLSTIARQTDATVVTAHSRDDQVETVLMRVLRDAGTRGLAGLYAPATVARPFTGLSRAELARYLQAVGGEWIEDPTNESMRFFRNRVRRDLLPAIARVSPQFDAQLLDLAHRARDCREGIDRVAARLGRVSPDGARLSVAASDLAPYSRAQLAALWPAIAARAGLAMDWRGTERAAAFTNSSRRGARIQLSGGWEIARTRDTFELRRWR